MASGSFSSGIDAPCGHWSDENHRDDWSTGRVRSIMEAIWDSESPSHPRKCLSNSSQTTSSGMPRPAADATTAHAVSFRQPTSASLSTIATARFQLPCSMVSIANRSLIICGPLLRPGRQCMEGARRRGTILNNSVEKRSSCACVTSGIVSLSLLTVSGEACGQMYGRPAFSCQP